VRIIALGELAERWLGRHFPEYANRVCRIVHFAAKPNSRTPNVAAEFKRQMRAAVESPEHELRFVQARPNVKYSLAGSPVRTMRGQRKALYQLLSSSTPDEAGEFSETEVMKLVYAAAARGDLVTPQCPWRIWTYYSPRLIDSGLIRLRTT
jgi:hypothetical protein